MPVKEASSVETPYGRYITSDGWFVLNLAEALAVRNEEKGGVGLLPLPGRRLAFAQANAVILAARESQNVLRLTARTLLQSPTV